MRATEEPHRRSAAGAARQDSLLRVSPSAPRGAGSSFWLRPLLSTSCQSGISPAAMIVPRNMPAAVVGAPAAVIVRNRRNISRAFSPCTAVLAVVLTSGSGERSCGRRRRGRGPAHRPQSARRPSSRSCVRRCSSGAPTRRAVAAPGVRAGEKAVGAITRSPARDPCRPEPAARESQVEVWMMGGPSDHHVGDELVEGEGRHAVRAVAPAVEFSMPGGAAAGE